jgi:hypothetical protein
LSQKKNKKKDEKTIAEKEYFHKFAHPNRDTQKEVL